MVSDLRLEVTPKCLCPSLAPYCQCVVSNVPCCQVQGRVISCVRCAEPGAVLYEVAQGLHALARCCCVVQGQTGLRVLGF
jgi:hypothetical protein